MKVGLCKKCGHNQHVGERVMGRLGMAVALGLMGGKAVKHPLAALLGASIGAAIGHVLDESVLPKCPGCGIALQLVEAAL
jgi:hypothetical protein